MLRLNPPSRTALCVLSSSVCEHNSVTEIYTTDFRHLGGCWYRCVRCGQMLVLDPDPCEDFDDFADYLVRAIAEPHNLLSELT